MMVKIDPGAQVNMIPLSRYWKLFPHKISESRHPKPGTLIPTSHSWISHDGKPKPFQGHFIAKVNHTTLPRSYPTHFCVHRCPFSSYPALLYNIRMPRDSGIQGFQPHCTITHRCSHCPTSHNPGDLRNTAKSVTLQDPLIDLDQSQHTSPSCSSSLVA